MCKQKQTIDTKANDDCNREAVITLFAGKQKMEYFYKENRNLLQSTNENDSFSLRALAIP